MAEHAATTDSPNFLQKHHFLLRRLHSLSGILPVGLFVIFHLFTNAQIIRGGAEFQKEVNFIHSMPALLAMEITIWASLAFHAGLGVVYTMQGKVNVRQYKYADNWRYTLQRSTGIIALIFIFVHIATLRWRWTFGGLFETFYVADVDGTPLAAATTARALDNNWVLLLYIIGVVSVIYHWCNGLWTAAITWGLTISPASQKRWGGVCAILAIALTVFMTAAIVGARTHEITDEEKAAMEAVDKDPSKIGHSGNIEHPGDATAH